MEVGMVEDTLVQEVEAVPRTFAEAPTHWKIEFSSPEVEEEAAHTRALLVEMEA